MVATESGQSYKSRSAWRHAGWSNGSSITEFPYTVVYTYTEGNNIRFWKQWKWMSVVILGPYEIHGTFVSNGNK